MTGPPGVPSLRAQRRGRQVFGLFSMLGMGLILLGGCNACPTELRGKTSFGPEFRNRGNNTHEVRYDARQALEMKWDNGWTTGISYRRRDVDDGTGDNENRVMVDVGYPLWKAPKPDKTARRIERLEEQLQEMRARVAEVKSVPSPEPEATVAQGNVGEVPSLGN